MTDPTAIRARLEDELARLRARAGRIDDHQHNRNREIPKDWEELATYRENDEVVDALDDMTRTELARIEFALRRMDEGTWGTCIDCEGPIQPERLAVMPTHALCVTCATTRETK